jgi:hypothetical protein
MALGVVEPIADFQNQMVHAICARRADYRWQPEPGAARAEQGLVDTDLGGGIIKQRVARPGQGRSSGYRMLIAYRAGHRAVFLYGFAKRERESIDPDELATLREIAAGWLRTDAGRIAQALKESALQEVAYDEKKEA